MGHTTNKLLNTMVAVTSIIVFMMMYDRMGSMLSPFANPTLELETSLSTLSEKCKEIWNRHKRSTRQQVGGKRIHKWHTKPWGPRYNTTGFCRRIPADVSAAHLWNEHLPWIMQASANVEYMSSYLLTSKLLQFLSPNQYLERAYRSRPTASAIGILLEKLDARLESGDAPMVHVVVFGAGVFHCDKKITVLDRGNKHGEMDSQDDCVWPARLETFLNSILNHFTKDESKHRPIIKLTPVYQTPNVATTVELDTAVVKSALWNDEILQHGGPDVILSAFNDQDMFLPKRNWSTATDINYYHQQRDMIQQFFRACLHACSSTSTSTSNKGPPLVIAVDDYVGNQQGPVMAENVQARVLQQLADYYEIGFVSYAEVIRKLVYASGNNALHHTNFNDFAEEFDTLTALTTANQQQIHHGYVGPIAMTMTLAYSLLKYAVSYCGDKADYASRDHTLVSQETMELAEQVPPPELNTDLRLNTIKGLWQQEQIKTKQRKCAATGNCPFVFWGGKQGTHLELDTYLKTHTVGAIVGWELAPDGRLVAIQESAHLTLDLGSLPKSKGSDSWKLQIFTTVRDQESSTIYAQLQWNLVVPPKGRRRNLLAESNLTSNHTQVHRRRRRLAALQDQTVGVIEGSHNSPATVALPTAIPIDPTLASSQNIHLTLQMIEGSEFEIVAIMLCGDNL